MARTITIGDIHGCSIALQTILKAINIQPTDTLITLGDYVDRGPNSKNTIEQLITLSDICNFIPLMGNHELMLMHAFEGKDDLNYWLRQGGRATLSSYGDIGSFDIDELKRIIPWNHMSFIKDCIVYHETDDYIFVHANYDWDVSMDKQTENSSFWHHIKEENPPKPHYSGKTVFVGHTAQTSCNILNLNHIICIDTWANNKNGWLTAIDVDTHKIWQTNQKEELKLGLW